MPKEKIESYFDRRDSKWKVLLQERIIADTEQEANEIAESRLELYRKARETDGDLIVEPLDELKLIRDRLQEARDAKCTCSSFTLQYDGCGCGKAEMIKQLAAELEAGVPA